MLWIKLTQRFANAPTPRKCNDPDRRDRKHKGGCQKSLTCVEHLFKCEGREVKGRQIHWLCHDCAPVPCPFDGTKPRRVNLKKHYQLQAAYFRSQIQALDSPNIHPEQAERLEGDRQVLLEIGKRLKRCK